MISDCKFCAIAKSDAAMHSNEFAVAFRDAFPLSAGHTLVIPRVHCVNLFALDKQTRLGVWGLVDDVQADLSEQFHPDGFNIGVNVGEAAGQTVLHAHVHVIPRWRGDVSDPRGGIRWVIPQNAPYWD